LFSPTGIFESLLQFVDDLLGPVSLTKGILGLRGWFTAAFFMHRLPYINNHLFVIHQRLFDYFRTGICGYLSFCGLESST